MSAVHVSTKINGDDVEFVCRPDESLLDVLRDRLGMTGGVQFKPQPATTGSVTF